MIPILNKLPTLCRVTQVETNQGLNEAKNTLKIWREVINDRLGYSRSKKLEGLISKESLAADRAIANNYIEVLGFLSLGIQKIEKDGFEQGLKKISIVIDSNGKIQGICTTTIKTDHVYVNALASAPWNIRMHAPVPESFISDSFKGSGKALMANAYSIARSTGKEMLKTVALGDSFAFYQVIGMTFDEETSTFTYEVNHSVPEALQHFFPIESALEE